MAGLLPLPVPEGWDGPSVGLPFHRRVDSIPIPAPHLHCSSPSRAQGQLPRASPVRLHNGAACQDTACESPEVPESYITPDYIFRVSALQLNGLSGALTKATAWEEHSRESKYCCSFLPSPPSLHPILLLRPSPDPGGSGQSEDQGSPRVSSGV